MEMVRHAVDGGPRSLLASSSPSASQARHLPQKLGEAKNRTPVSLNFLGEMSRNETERSRTSGNPNNCLMESGQGHDTPHVLAGAPN